MIICERQAFVAGKGNNKCPTPAKHALSSAHLAHKVSVKGSPSPMERQAPACTPQTDMAGGPPQLPSAGGSPQLQTCDGSPPRKRRSEGEQAPRKQPRSSKDLSPASTAETLTLDFWEQRDIEVDEDTEQFPENPSIDYELAYTDWMLSQLSEKDGTCKCKWVTHGTRWHRWVSFLCKYPGPQ